MKCSHCNGTGELHGMGYYDCTNCSAADDRAALEASVKAMPPMTREDVLWAAYQAGERIAEQRWQTERDELIRQLRKMWGWAIELDNDTGYFGMDAGPGGTSKEDWRADTRKTLALLQTYDHKKG